MIYRFLFLCMLKAYRVMFEKTPLTHYNNLCTITGGLPATTFRFNTNLVQATD